MREVVTDENVRVELEEVVPSKPEWVVPHPITGTIIHNPVFARAIIEGKYTIENGKLYVAWDDFMARRQPYARVPDWFSFTREETELHLKMCNESFIEVKFLRRFWPGRMPMPPIELIQRLKIPLYRFPFPSGGKDFREYVFAGDLVRAFRGCEVPYLTDVFHAADLRRRVKWGRRLEKRYGKTRRREEKRKKMAADQKDGALDKGQGLEAADQPVGVAS